MTGVLLILTAGISLFENLENPTKEFNQIELVKDFRHTGSGAWRKVLNRAVGGTFRAELVHFADPFGSIELRENPQRKRSTAEIAGTYLASLSESQRTERLVILCSDTGEGAFCALVNAMLLAREVRCFRTFAGDLSPQNRYETIAGFDGESEIFFAETLEEVRLPAADLIVVKDLDPQDPDAFELTGLPNLIETIANIHYGRSPTQVAEQKTIVNYTGGYKAAVPALTQAAALAGNIEMACLYEEGTRLIQHPLIPLQLSNSVERRLLNAATGNDQDLLARQLPWSALRHELEPEERPLYEGDKTRCTLSMVGRAAQTMLTARARLLSQA